MGASGRDFFQAISPVRRASIGKWGRGCCDSCSNVFMPAPFLSQRVTSSLVMFFKRVGQLMKSPNHMPRIRWLSCWVWERCILPLARKSSFAFFCFARGFSVPDIRWQIDPVQFQTGERDGLRAEGRIMSFWKKSHLQDRLGNRFGRFPVLRRIVKASLRLFS